MIDGLGGFEVAKATPYTFYQPHNETWWCVWNGYSLGPFSSKEEAEEEWHRTYEEYHAPPSY